MGGRDLSFLEASLDMALRAVQMHQHLSSALDKVAARIEHDAKAKLGEYQDGNSMHGPWAELAESTKAQRVRLGYTENDPLLRSGELRDSISHETQGLEAQIGSTSDIAVYQELGTAGARHPIPPRPFLGAAAWEARRYITAICGGAVVAGIVGDRRADYALIGGQRRDESGRYITGVEAL